MPWEASKSNMKSFALEVLTVFEWEMPQNPAVALGRPGFVSEGAAVLAPQTPNAVMV